jgi:hypothetical protein
MTEAEADDPPVVALTKKEKKQKEQDQLTKRQRRKQTNDEHLWPQHPKITSPAGRARAYLRTAGLYAGGSKNKTLDNIDPAVDLNSPQIKFGRLLGATDQRVRHEAVLQLSAYLKARCDINNETGGLSELDLLKLWKGLWYTLYMADKVPVQDELSAKIAQLIWCVAGTEEEDEYAGKAYLDMFGDDGANIGFEGEDEDGVDSDSDEEVVMEEIENTLDEGYEEHSDADDSMESEEDSNGEEDEHCGEEEDEEFEELHDSEIPHCRGAHLASLFARTFFATVRREWGKMDKYRVDKFYTLMRFMMQQIYKYMAVRHWNVGIIRLFNDALYEEILSRTPNGLRFHLIDIALDELAAVHAEAPMPLTEATFLDCMEPFFAMAQTGAGGDNVVQSRVVENVLGKFLDKYSVVSEGVDDEANDGEEDKVIFDQVHVETVSKFIFQIASDAATADRYRKSLYDLHKKYVRRLRQSGRDVDVDNGGEGDDAIPDEVNDLPDDSEMQDDQEADEAAEEKNEKKKKRRKKGKDSKKDVSPHKDSNIESEAPKNVKAHEKKEKKSGKKNDSKKDVSPSKDSKDESQAPENVKTHEKKEKKSKKNNSKKDLSPHKDSSNESQASEDVKAHEKKEKKSKKNNSKKDVSPQKGSNIESQAPENVKAHEKKEKKSKKNKKQNGSENSAHAHEEGGDAEEITISMDEQKAAKEAMQPKRKSPEESQVEVVTKGTPSGKKRKKQGKFTEVEVDNSSPSDRKRVSFNKKNQARSWKASMKGLNTMEVPPTPEATPEKGIKGILRMKTSAEKLTPKGKSANKRKKATDYFH